MRKLTFLFLACLSVLTMLTACSDSDTETVLTADDLFTTKEVNFDGLAGDQYHTIEFEAPKAWTAEVHCLGSWLSADVLRGQAGKSVITIKPTSDNFGTTAREATLDIYIDGMESYTIKVYQNSAATGDIQVNGHVNDGVMILASDDSGIEFSDTLWVTSTKKWNLRTDAASGDVLSFETDGESRNGEETTVRVVVKASYAKFVASQYESKFYIQTEEGTAVPITVKASAYVGVYDHQNPMMGETERTGFELVDTVQTGLFMTDFYVESNIRWTLGTMPEWIEAAADPSTITNMTSAGKINTRRQHISFHLKADQLSRDGKTGVIELIDMRGETVKRINVSFAGVGSNYVANNLSLRSDDPNGNPWGFEAKAEYIDPNNEAEFWKEVAHSFDITTSVNFTSMADAPFHLILVDATGGMPHKREMHWAKLEMAAGDATNTGDLYTRTIAIRVNDRGDSDDTNGLTDPTQWRHAFVYIVPNNVKFDDLWDGNNLKAQYANDLVLMAQKNDPAANYTFGLKEVKDGGTVNVAAKGGAVTMNVLPGSYSKCDVNIQSQAADGSWVRVNSDVCTMDYTRDGEELKIITFTLSENKKVKNPITQKETGAPRHLRVSFVAFLGDNEGSKVIFTFYIDQPLNE